MRAVIADENVVVEHTGALPGETSQQADARVAKGLAGTPSAYPGAGEDPSGVFAAWTAAVGAVHPGLTTTPTLFEAGTATGAWRARGIPVYGIYPYLVDGDSINRMHGNDERVGIDALRRSADSVRAVRTLPRLRSPPAFGGGPSSDQLGGPFTDHHRSGVRVARARCPA